MLTKKRHYGGSPKAEVNVGSHDYHAESHKSATKMRRTYNIVFEHF